MVSLRPPGGLQNKTQYKRWGRLGKWLGGESACYKKHADLSQPLLSQIKDMYNHIQLPLSLDCPWPPVSFHCTNIRQKLFRAGEHETAHSSLGRNTHGMFYVYPELEGSQH